MTKAHKRRGLGVALILAAVTALAMATPMAASAARQSGAAPAAPPCNISGQQVIELGTRAPSQRHHRRGQESVPTLVPVTNPRPSRRSTARPRCYSTGHGGAANCFFAPCDNGNVMMTASTGPLVVVPIFWVPSGYSMSASYKNILTSYLGDVAKDSGSTHNVFSVPNEYYGNNGQIQYNVKLGPVHHRHQPDARQRLHAGRPVTRQGSTRTARATTPAWTMLSSRPKSDSVTAANNLPHNLSHIYVLYLPKARRVLLPARSDHRDPGGQFCTINHQPTAAYCAYHSTDLNSAVYANMPYPIYESPVGFTCGTDARFPTIESPNGNPDADTEVSPTSHEINEAITDPDTETGWYDSTGNENGDDCAYVFGRTRGAPGVLQPGDQRRALHYPGRVQQQGIQQLRRYRRVRAGPVVRVTTAR